MDVGNGVPPEKGGLVRILVARLYAGEFLHRLVCGPVCRILPEYAADRCLCVFRADAELDHGGLCVRPCAVRRQRHYVLDVSDPDYDPGGRVDFSQL
ncbi:hypothetical protein D3C75_1139740 [compost metagenome]